MDLKDIREAAKVLGGDDPEDWGWLLWLDARLASDGEPPVTPWWRWALLDFWRSGRPFFAALKGQRATSSTTVAKCLVPGTLLRERSVVLGQQIACLLMSAGTAEANQRRNVIKKALGTFGLREVDRREKLGAGTFTATEAAQGRSTFETRDAAGNEVVFSIRPGTLEAASGATGAGALVDELDLWDERLDKKSPAAEVLTVLYGRLHGQRGAHVYHVSTPMGPHAPLSTMTRLAERNGSASLYVARLGEDGARRDEVARAKFRQHLETVARRGETERERRSADRWAQDPRLTFDADPASHLIPTWAARAGDPREEILECWRLVQIQLVDAEEGGDPLDVLFARYGAQATGDGGRRLFGAGVLAEAQAMVL